MVRAALLAVAVALAAPPGPVNDPALVAAAQAEGALQVYGVGPAEALEAKARRFEATYGIKVSSLRVGGAALPPRLLVEARGGNSKTDVVIGVSGLELEQIKRAGLFAQYRPPENRDLLPGTVDPDGTWAATKSTPKRSATTRRKCWPPASSRR